MTVIDTGWWQLQCKDTDRRRRLLCDGARFRGGGRFRGRCLTSWARISRDGRDGHNFLQQLSVKRRVRSLINKSSGNCVEETDGFSLTTKPTVGEMNPEALVHRQAAVFEVVTQSQRAVKCDTATNISVTHESCFLQQIRFTPCSAVGPLLAFCSFLATPSRIGEILTRMFSAWHGRWGQRSDRGAEESHQAAAARFHGPALSLLHYCWFSIQT